MDLYEEIVVRLSDGFSDGEIAVTVEGNRASVTVQSCQFEGLSAVKRQQLVYGCLNDLIRSGSLHAISIDATTPDG